jgi:hypothetical protein
VCTVWLDIAIATLFTIYSIVRCKCCVSPCFPPPAPEAVAKGDATLGPTLRARTAAQQGPSELHRSHPPHLSLWSLRDLFIPESPL